MNSVSVENGQGTSAQPKRRWFSYIYKESTVLAALAEIRQSRIMAVDCEGSPLNRSGRLALLQVAIPFKDYGNGSDNQHQLKPIQVYVFDVLRLGPKLFDMGLRDILEDMSIIKVFYDCRKDSDILYHQYGVSMCGVVDTAIVEIWYRKLNLMGDPRYLMGFKKCVEQYLPHVAKTNPRFSFLKTTMRQKMNDEGNDFWVIRPLAFEGLEYAAYDVKYLLELHVKLTEEILEPNWIRKIILASHEFVTQCQREVDSDEEQSALVASHLLDDSDEEEEYPYPFTVYAM